MSHDSSDDDIPGLASLSGSEAEDESDDFSSDDADPDVEDEGPRPPHLFDSSLWLMWNTSVLCEHVEVLRIYVLSPFLYGHAHQSDRWLKWCHEVGLLQSDIEFNLEALSKKELIAVDILLEAVDYVGVGMSGENGDVSRLMQVMEKVEVEDTPTMAARAARRWNWFIILIDNIRDSMETDAFSNHIIQSKRYFVDIGCLFVMNQARDHIKHVLKGTADYHGDYYKQRISHEESGEVLKKEGEEYEKRGDFVQAIETYTTAIICCPYYQQLYINRAYAYMQLKNYRASVADGIRAVHLKPSNSKAHMCYIRALEAAGDTRRRKMAVQKFMDKFPGERDEFNLQEPLDKSGEMLARRARSERRRRELNDRTPSDKDHNMNDKIVGTCKQASEAYLAGNIDQAVYYYQEAVTSSEEEGWRACWVFSDCERFLVSLYCAFGMALLKKGSSNDADMAMTQFNHIITNHLFNFPPAYYGVGKALVLLHNHTEARVHIKRALELLPSYRAAPLTWPGTSTIMVECMPHDVESKLQHLLQQCEPKQVPDAVCRYLGCLQHHTSSNIMVDNADYKGYIRMACSEGCNICYHPACWRKFKGDSVVGADKDFMGTPCPTPDCEGDIRSVWVYDHIGLKKQEGEPGGKKTAPSVPLTSLNLGSKENKRGKHGKKKPLGSPLEGGGSKLDTREEASIEKAELVVIEEDRRRSEDSVVVINRQEEVEEEQQDGNGSKAIKLKKKMPREKNKASSEHWNDLFSLPKRDGLVKGSTSDDDNSVSSKWEPNPEHPFTAPQHLRDMIDDFEVNEAPAIGLLPRPLVGGKNSEPPSSGLLPTPTDPPSKALLPTPAGPPKAEEPPNPVKVAVDEDMEFFVSYFGEIVRTHGPVDPTDTQILEPLSFLPEDKKEKITRAGGIAKLLVNSGHFAMQGKLICPIEELSMVTASMSADSASQNQSSKAGGVGAERHDSGKDKPPDDPGKAKATDSATTPSPFAQKSSLSGLLSSRGSRQDYPQQRPQHNSKPSKAQLEEAGSKRNTSALVPKLGEMITDLCNPAAPKRNVVEDIRRAQLKKISEEKQIEKESEEKLKKASKDSDNVTSSSDRDSRASSSRDSRPSSMDSKSSKSSKSKDKSSSSSNRSSVKDSGSSDEKRKKIGKDPAPLSSAKDNFDLKLRGFDKVTAMVRKGMDELSIGGASQRTNSKDSSRSSSSSEKGSQSGGHGSQGQNEDVVARRDMFSPTSSTSSMSSSESSSGVATPSIPLKAAVTTEAKKPKTKKAKKGKPKADDLLPLPSKPGTGTHRETVSVQTDTPLMTDQWVMTDTIPPVDSFRDRYEKATKEKKDLQEKLERSEDQRFKLQKTHKREVEQLVKQGKAETKEAVQSSLVEMEGKLKVETTKVESVRRESGEQIRSMKGEIKSLTDKIERMKKDTSKKDTQHDSKVRQMQSTMDQLEDDRQLCNERLKVSREAETKAIVRATNAEVEVLSMRSDLVVKPWEQKLRELDAMCLTLPPSSDVQMECMGCRDKMKVALETFQVAVEDQMRMVKAGRDLSSMERIPNPVPPPQLGMLQSMMMRPGFYPMMSVPRAPFPMGGMMRAQMGVPPQMGGVPVSVSPFLSQPEPDLVPTPTNFPKATLGEPESSSQAAASSLSELDMASGTGPGGGKKSSFDRIVEKLAPSYPQYNREDFKAFLREVRRQNKNTLSGLSLDTIAQQVKDIIEVKELKKRGNNAVTAKGKAPGGKGRSESRPVENKGRPVDSKGRPLTENKARPDSRPVDKKKKQRPQVATAPPPVSSSVDYDENSCIICYEDMRDVDTSRLDCGHHFHSKCIRSWFKEQNTCPTCRNHSLLVDEYPTLK